ncbi:MAG: TonB-dependent receptor [Deltaproteobacteria bacterium]|nr:TonB-dependent receptor [Deltaproteobacteria bacterium]
MPYRFARPALFALALLVAFAVPAWAQDDEPVAEDQEEKSQFDAAEMLGAGKANDDATRPEMIVTAERTPEDKDRAARAVSTVTRDEIFDQMARTVPEALTYEEGVMVQRTNQGGGAPFIRGLVGNQVLYLVDGIRVNNSTFRGGPNQYLNTIDPFFVDRIEVVRGPSSVLYGSDALGGAINVITHRRDNFGDKSQVDGRLMQRFTTGEDEQTSHLDFDGNVKDAAGYAFSGNFRKFGDVDPGRKEPPQSPYDYEEQDFAGNLDFHLTDKVTLQTSVQYVNLDDVPNYDPGNPKNNFEPQRRLMAYGKVLVDDLAPGLDRIEAFGSYQQQTEGREKISAAAPDTETRDLDVVDTLGAGLQLESAIGPWVRFVYGGEYYQDDISSERETEDLPSGDVDKLDDAQFPDGSTFTSVAAYAEARVTPVDWLKLVPGVRYSAFTPDIELDDPATGTVKVDDTIDDVTWSAHVWVQPIAYNALVLGASRGFRVPSVDDLSKLGSEDGRFDVPNVDLDPETLVQYEAGYRLTHPNVNFSFFYYYSMIDDLIARKPATYNGDDTIGGDPVYRNENVGEAYIYGWETSAKLIAIPDVLYAGAAASSTFGQNETDDEPLRRIPPLMGNGYIHIGDNPIWLEGVVEASAKQDRLSQGDKDDSRIGPDGTPAFTVYHIRLGAYPTDWVEIVMAVENIGDVLYKYHGSGLYEPGRNYKAQLSFLF